ncbi:MAG: hypothetical protein A3I61_17600 [Acidobacteria bacterium RIFCSPLOWO2_02_FULL_68_18]|nr:MAG: hypothetical protein A3I61_17600 [Acidobacteria bacterium RIFCSPLOWO2_02_FULL_68_18]OFW51435.1 MAG: hypothetical protein A3G77_18045 [Acidobacteria bacterium RIFCSPLOWO2_12_FULL_68_19]
MSFRPSAYRPLFGGGHRQTLYAWARQRRFPRLPDPAARYFDTAADARVLAHCHWHPKPANHPTILLLHGLEGSSLTHYMCGISDKAWALGWNIVRLNQRNCGGTEHLSRGLYHSGLTQDALVVIRELLERDGLQAIAVAGYSLGGNLALKLAGELGSGAPAALRAVCAVSPTMDLARSVDALERRSNAVYEWHFLRNLKARMRRKTALFPGAFRLEPLGRIRSIRRFDDVYTAPHHGFRDSADYYYRVSAMRVVDRIRVPTLIMTAEDDPFVPPAPVRHPSVTSNPDITVAMTPQGGHCAFLERATGHDDGYWAEREIMRFASAHLGDRDTASADDRIQAPSPTLRA